MMDGTSVEKECDCLYNLKRAALTTRLASKRGQSASNGAATPQSTAIDAENPHEKSNRAADRHLLDAQRRLPDAHRHALTFLPAHADAAIQRHIVADHRHVLERFRPAADQRRALHRIRDLAVLDHVRL